MLNLSRVGCAHQNLQLVGAAHPTDGYTDSENALDFVSKLVRWPSEAVGTSEVVESHALKIRQFRAARLNRPIGAKKAL